MHEFKIMKKIGGDAGYQTIKTIQLLEFNLPYVKLQTPVFLGTSFPNPSGTLLRWIWTFDLEFLIHSPIFIILDMPLPGSQ